MLVGKHFILNVEYVTGPNAIHEFAPIVAPSNPNPSGFRASFFACDSYSSSTVLPSLGSASSSRNPSIWYWQQLFDMKYGMLFKRILEC